MTSYPELEFSSRFDIHRMVGGMDSHPIPGDASCCAPHALQFRNPQQVVRVSGDLSFRLADKGGLSHCAHYLEIAEDFLNALSFVLADLVAAGAGRSPIKPRCLAPFNRGNVRPDVVFAQMLDEVFHMLALVVSQPLGMNLARPGTGEQLPSRFMLGQGGIGDEQINAQAVRCRWRAVAP
mgnify:CR=1 FL=1